MTSFSKETILDHGYLGLVDSWGSDEAVVEAARMSTGKGFLGWEPGICPECEGRKVVSSTATIYSPNTKQIQIDSHTMRLEPSSTEKQHEVSCPSCDGKGSVRGDKHLLRYLWEHKHATPFEMVGMVIEVQAPIFVFREWHRHRTQSYNEMSARYIPLPDVNYIPSVERLMQNSKTNKQAGTILGAAELTELDAEHFQAELRHSYGQAEKLYRSALRAGVPKELARIHLPVGRYSRMRASANLRNWLAFLTLRMDSAAQWEIRQYANAVGALIAKLFPRTWEIAGKEIVQ